MKEYNVATLIRILMEIIVDTQYITGRLVLEPVAKHESVRVNVTDKMISNLLKDKERTEIHGSIKSGAGRPEVQEFAKERIQKGLLPRIPVLRMDDFCEIVIGTLVEDKKVSRGFCDTMQNLYASKDYLGFVTNAVLYALSITNLPKEETVSPEDLSLLAQSNYKCPLNGTSFWKKSKKNSSGYDYSFQIVQIYPEDLSEDLRSEFDVIQLPPKKYDSPDNCLPLCKACAEKYMDNPSADVYARLLACKSQILKKTVIDRISSQSDVEDEIVIIIRAISRIDGNTVLEPFSDVLKIEEKILPENFVLGETVHDDVIKYYPFIQEQFSLLDGSENATFNVIRSEVMTCYEKYAREGLDQNSIFAELSNWLLSVNGLTPKFRGAADILVSFFVQNCAVFTKHKIINKVNGEEGEE